MYAIRADLILLGRKPLLPDFESGHRHQIRRAFPEQSGSPFFVAGAGWGHCDVSSMHFFPFVTAPRCGTILFSQICYPLDLNRDSSVMSLV